jgi:hypothetical protein
LQITVTAIHRAITCEIDDKIVAANLTVTARTLLKELALVPGQKEFPFCRAELIDSTIVHCSEMDPLDNRNGDLRQRRTQVVEDRARFGTTLNH